MSKKKRGARQHQTNNTHRKLQHTTSMIRAKEIPLKMIRFAKRQLSLSSFSQIVCVTFWFSRASHASISDVLVVFFHFAAMPIPIVMPCHTIPDHNVPYTVLAVHTQKMLSTQFAICSHLISLMPKHTKCWCCILLFRARFTVQSAD